MSEIADGTVINDRSMQNMPLKEVVVSRQLVDCLKNVEWMLKYLYKL